MRCSVHPFRRSLRSIEQSSDVGMEKQIRRGEAGKAKKKCDEKTINSVLIVLTYY